MGEGKTLVVLGAMAEGSTREDWFAKERFTEVKKGEPESAMEKKRERERECGRDVARIAWYGE